MTNEELFKLKRVNELYINVYPLIYKYASKWLLGVEFEEKISMCNLSFAKALKTYNPGKGCKFSTWLSCNIECDLKRYKIRSEEPKRQAVIFSLETEIYGEESPTLEAFLQSDYNLEDEAISRLSFHEKYSRLSDRQKEVINLKLKGLRQSDIAEKIGVTQTQVSRIINKIKTKYMSC